ncbi:Trm112 family protein [Hippea jasoniae]|uniref:Trm112 family protein n=1 Tax=Hippea jasoniae TaxID=944479 RepID=UPI0009FFA342|nr:Trm112 family protein [Hippea jasoniae]
MAVDERLLEILACPKCRGDLKLSDDKNWLICESCKVKYPIEDDIPILLIDKAEKLEND